jgi:hypothetical protein
MPDLGSNPVEPGTMATEFTVHLMYNIFKHQAQRLDGTLVGQIFKRAGIIEPNFDDRLYDILNKSLSLYHKEHPDYDLFGIKEFLSKDKTFITQIGDFILDRRPFEQQKLQEAFDQYPSNNNDPQTREVLKLHKLDPKRMIPDFLECYRKVLRSQLSLPDANILLDLAEQPETKIKEIRTDDKDYVTALKETKLSPPALQAAYRAGQQELAFDVADLVQADQAGKASQVIRQSVATLFTTGLCKGYPLHSADASYFVAHGFGPDILADWRRSIVEAVTRTNSTIKLLKPYFSGDTVLSGYRLCGICEKLYSSYFSFFLLPVSQDRNVYLELGIAIGLQVPFFLIKQAGTTTPPVLSSLGGYVKQGSFRTMRGELTGQVNAYDFGALRFTKTLANPPTQKQYLLVAGELPDDEDFEASISDAIEKVYPQRIKSVSLASELSSLSGPGWQLEQLVEAIQVSRFAIYRVDEQCSPTTFLALGVSIGLNRPFLMIHERMSNMPHDLQGIGIYQFPNYTKLADEIVPRYRDFFDRYTF